MATPLLAAGHQTESDRCASQADHAKRLGSRHRVRGDVCDELHVFACSQAGDEAIELEHEADVLAAYSVSPRSSDALRS
jgi:hypothetical protein